MYPNLPTVEQPSPWVSAAERALAKQQGYTPAQGPTGAGGSPISSAISAGKLGYDAADGLGAFSSGAPSAPVGISAKATSAAPTTAGIFAQAPGTTLGGSATLGSALPALGVAAGAYTGYQQLKGAQNILKGGDLNTQQQVALALPTFGASLLYNPVKKMLGIGHGKNYYDHQARKAKISELFGGDGTNVQLGNQTYDLSAEADKKLYGHKMDHSKASASAGIQYFKPLAAILAGGDRKMTDDLVRIFYNQTTNGGDVDENGLRQAALRLYGYKGLKPSDVINGLTQLVSSGALSQSEMDGLVGGVNALKVGGKPIAFSVQPGMQPNGTVVTPVGASGAGGATPQGTITQAPRTLAVGAGSSASSVARKATNGR